jgi:hypothetical protein
MHVHLPKPVQGWREFIGEVGIIVIGVLIALAGEQIAERMSWRKHVAEAKEDLHSELEGNLFNAQEQVLMAPCVEHRLDQLEQVVDHPPAMPWKLLPGHGLAPIRVWSASGWDSAVAAGTVTHMVPSERAEYAGVYSFVRRMQQLTFDEFAVATEFRMLERGGPLSEATQDRLRADIARVRGYNQVLTLGGTQISKEIRALGVELSPSSRKSLANLKCPMPADTIPSASEQSG